METGEKGEPREAPDPPCSSVRRASCRPRGSTAHCPSALPRASVQATRWVTPPNQGQLLRSQKEAPGAWALTTGLPAPRCVLSSRTGPQVGTACVAGPRPLGPDSLFVLCVQGEPGEPGLPGEVGMRVSHCGCVLASQGASLRQTDSFWWGEGQMPPSLCVSVHGRLFLNSYKMKPRALR